MGPSFHEQFDRFVRWRKGFAAELAGFGNWLAAQELLDAPVQDQLLHLENLLRSDKLRVAFVAEFSRGKSELINAVFFAHYGRRIMPAASGRTTLCATELSYDANLQACLRLLPVETRAQPYSLAEWRSRPSTWVQLPLDVNDPEQLAQTIASVAQVQKVTQAQAQALGFWSNVPGTENPVCDAQGLVAIPKWRHALINMAHPLLQQGLVILDTPGLNTVGAEPELTVDLIAQAHSVVFLLAADAGVTKADLAIWKEHLLPSHRTGDGHLVVLNKIDTLLRPAATEADRQALIKQLCAQSAQALAVEVDRVVAVSAHQGLLAKIDKDEAKLQSSGLPLLEDFLAHGILQHRQSVLGQVMAAGVKQLQAQVMRTLQMRDQHADAHIQALRALCGASAENVGQRIAQEQGSLEEAAVVVMALRSEHLKLMNQAFQCLGATALRKDLEQLSAALEHSGLEVGVRHVYASAFERLRSLGDQVKAAAGEVQSMLASRFAQLNTQFGFTLQVPQSIELQSFDQELAHIEASYLQYLDFGYALKLAHPLFGERMVRVLGLRLRALFESTASELDLWSKSATSQVDAQWTQRKRSFARFLEAVDHIHQVPAEAVERIAQAEAGKQQLQQLELRLDQWVQRLLITPPHPAQPSNSLKP